MLTGCLAYILPYKTITGKGHPQVRDHLEVPPRTCTDRLCFFPPRLRKTLRRKESIWSVSRLRFFRHSPQSILMCNSNFGYQEPFLLLATHSTREPKYIKFAEFWGFDFGTGFGTVISAQTPGFWGPFQSLPETSIFDTTSLGFQKRCTPPLEIHREFIGLCFADGSRAHPCAARTA